MKILIVEDESSSAKYLEIVMRKYGMCDTCENGLEAFQRIKESYDKKDPYTLILMDIMMPVLDGKSALKRIRALEEEYNIIGCDRIKIIMTSALGDGENIRESFLEQADGYIEKPVRKEMISAELKKLELVK